MLKKVAISVFLVLLFLTHPHGALAADYFVSPSGSDSNPGTQDQPFQTLSKAVSKSSESQNSSDVNIFLQGGIYYQTDTVTLNQSNWNGSHKLTIQAKPGDIPTLSGGKVVSGTWTDKGNNIWEIDATPYLDSKGDIRQLFEGATRIPKSRFPAYSTTELLTPDQYNDTGTSVHIKNYSGTIPQNPGDHAELVMLHQWVPSMVGISGISQNLISLKARPWFESSWSVQLDTTTTYFYIENLPLEGATDPGPLWEFDKTRKMLRVKMPANSSPQNLFAVPVVNSLLSFDGTGNITVKGITFEHARGWEMPTLKSGQNGGMTINCDGNCYYDVQAGNYVQYDPSASADALSHFFPGAVVIKNSHDISFVDGVIAHSGGIGVSILEGNNNLTLDNNTITDIGSNCINIGTLARNSNYTKNVKITNNSINACGAISPSGVGIWEAFSRFIEVANNEISNISYTGISFGWDWGNRTDDGLTNNSNSIHNNLIHDFCKRLMDCGGIYTIGANQASSITNNVIYDARVPPEFLSLSFNAVGLYFDNATAGFTVNNNIVYNMVLPKYAWYFQALHPYESLQSDFVLGTNYLNVAPGQTSYPTAIANAAGISQTSQANPLKSAVMNGTNVTVTFDTTNVNASDWIGVYKVGSAHTAFLSWKWINDATGTTPTTLTTNGKVNLTVPNTIDAYDVRYFNKNGYQIIGSLAVTAGSSSKSGDLNGDGKVDIFDYNLLVTNFGKTGTAGFSSADIDKNGKVDIFDYNQLVANFGK